MENPIRPDSYIVKLDMFEGPLDLLLHLIKKHELSIENIPISFITKKYLEYMDLMKEFNLDIASDYLEMAATLAYIKSRSMVPAAPSAEEDDGMEGPDPREELILRLLEYQKYKTAAGQLAGLPMLGRDTFPVGSPESMAVDRDLANPGLFGLMEAFHAVLKRTKPETVHEVTSHRISISARIAQLVEILLVKQRVVFVELFENLATRGEMVVSFLAILEMVKLGLARVHQAELCSEIYILASDTIGESGHAIEVSVSEDE